MKKITKLGLTAVTLLVLALANPAQAYQGIYGFGIEINASGAGATNAGTSLYGLDNYGDNGGHDLVPTGSSATLRSTWTDGSTASTPSFSLGTVSTLTLNGGAFLTYAGGGGGYTSTTLDYDLYDVTTSTDISGGYQSIALSVNATNVTNPGNVRWSNETAGINLLAGLNTTDVYELKTFGFANPNGGGTDYYNNPNGGYQNWGATFSVANVAAVPEPSTWAMLLGGFFLLAFVVRRRQVPA